MRQRKEGLRHAVRGLQLVRVKGDIRERSCYRLNEYEIIFNRSMREIHKDVKAGSRAHTVRTADLILLRRNFRPSECPSERPSE
jgi:hypothetical protein